MITYAQKGRDLICLGRINENELDFLTTINSYDACWRIPNTGPFTIIELLLQCGLSGIAKWRLISMFQGYNVPETMFFVYVRKLYNIIIHKSDNRYVATIITRDKRWVSYDQHYLGAAIEVLKRFSRETKENPPFFEEG
jgi:hypothetical protein